MKRILHLIDELGILATVGAVRVLCGTERALDVHRRLREANGPL